METLDLTHPELAKQWHPTKNGVKKPADFKASSKIKVWWVCPITCQMGCLHEWETSIRNRTNGSGCSFCSKPKKKTCIHESIVNTNPDIIKEWHPTKNIISPSEITSSSDRRAWWLCDKITCSYGCKHEWETQVKVRCKQGLGCPHCSKKKWCEHMTIKFTNPELSTQLHPFKNGSLKSSDLVSGSSLKIWWICEKTCPSGCKHEWQTTVNNRTRGDSCPWCSNHKSCEHVSILYTHPDLCKELHPNKNENMNYNTILASSHLKVWWKCDKSCSEGCIHEWEASVSSRTRLNSKCPYCCNQKICVHNSLEYKYPKIASQLHPTKNIISACKINPYSDKKYWWFCEKTCKQGCLHEWEACVNSRVRGLGCPHCSRKGPGRSYCEHVSILYSHPLVVAEWHPTKNIGKSPTQFVFGSHERVWWVCKYNHEWEIPVKSRCIGTRGVGAGCPICVNKTETKLYDYLVKLFPTIKKQLKLESCKNKTYLPFDFCIPELNVIIELDGLQHFKQVSNWQSPEKSIKRDIFKMQKAIKQGYKIIRIFQEDVYKYDESWLEETLLPEIQSEDRSAVFISAEIEGLYDEHIKLFELNEEISPETSDTDTNTIN